VCDSNEGVGVHLFLGTLLNMREKVEGAWLHVRIAPNVGVGLEQKEEAEKFRNLEPAE